MVEHDEREKRTGQPGAARVSEQAPPTPAEIEALIDGAWGAPSVGHACATGRELAERVLATGNAHFASLIDGSTTYVDPVAHRYYTFAWPEPAKRFLALWRNCVIEWERYLAVAREGGEAASHGEALAAEIGVRLRAAAEVWLGAGGRELARLRDDADLRARQLYAWSLQDNPWPTYRTQLQTLAEQFAALRAETDERLADVDGVVRLRAYVSALPTQLLAQYDSVVAGTERALEVLNDPEATRVARVSTTRLQALEVIETADARLDAISQAAAALVDELPDERMFYAVAADGRALARPLALETLAGQWISSELLPELQRGTRVVETAAAELSRTLVDIRNRVTLAREIDAAEAEGPPAGAVAAAVTDPQQTVARLAALLERLRDRLRDRRLAVETVGSYVATLADRELRLSRAYDAALEFLEVSFEGNVSRMRLQQNAIWAQAGTWVRERGRELRRVTRVALGAEGLSVGERIIRTIRSRRPDPANDAYTSVLVARGFIGEAFHAGRAREVARAVAAIEAWRAGFRGSVLVTGRRYAGKTHFVELLAGRHFENAVIRLTAKRQVDFAGRRLAPTANLAEALGFVRKYTSGQRLLVLVDDLELWTDRDHSLAANADALREALDTSSSRLMFVVTTSNWILGHLAAATDLAGAFQVQINMDAMPADDFEDTVMTRHAATHMSVVDEDGKPLDAGALRRRARRMHAVARGNVGDGLRRWARAMELVDPTTVRFRDLPNHALPPFLDANTGVLLADIKQQRYSNEYDLRRRFGPAFDLEFRPVLQRLIGLDVLQRHRTGTLSINPVISNEIARLLERDGFLSAGSPTYAKLT